MLNGLVDLSIGPAPLTVANELSITVAADTDPADPKDLIVLILSLLTWAEGGAPIIVDEERSSRGERWLLLLLFDKGEGRMWEE